MKAVWAAFAGALQLAAQAAPDAATLLADPRPLAFDHFALKEALGPQAFRQLRDAASAEYRRRIFEAGACMTRSELQAYESLLLAEHSKSANGFAADRQAGEAMVQEAEAQWPRLLAGEKIAGLEVVSTALGRSRDATDPRLKALYARMARDQFVRIARPARQVDFAAPFKDLPAFYASQVLGGEMCVVDADNRAWLEADFARNGWFRLSTYGEAADTAAFLIVQHADRDRAFQRRMLKELEALAAQHETRPRTYAYLYDRLASAEQRPQRYGAQGRCTPAKTWEPNPVEEPERLDERRASVGLGPEADYIASFKAC